MSGHLYHSPETLMAWIQRTAVSAAEAFAKGEIDEQEYQRALTVDREQLTAELLKTIRHLRIRTGREVRDGSS